MPVSRIRPFTTRPPTSPFSHTLITFPPLLNSRTLLPPNPTLLPLLAGLILLIPDHARHNHADNDNIPDQEPDQSGEQIDQGGDQVAGEVEDGFDGLNKGLEGGKWRGKTKTYTLGNRKEGLAGREEGVEDAAEDVEDGGDEGGEGVGDAGHVDFFVFFEK